MGVRRAATQPRHGSLRSSSTVFQTEAQESAGVSTCLGNRHPGARRVPSPSPQLFLRKCLQVPYECLRALSPATHMLQPLSASWGSTRG